MKQNDMKARGREICEEWDWQGLEGYKRVWLREYSQNVLHMSTKSSRNRLNERKKLKKLPAHLEYVLSWEELDKTDSRNRMSYKWQWATLEFKPTEAMYVCTMNRKVICRKMKDLIEKVKAQT